jgi:hypothetical protein
MASCRAQPPDTYRHPCPQQNVHSTLPSAQTAGWIRLSGPWGAVARAHAANGLQIDPLPEKIVLMLIVTTVDRLAASVTN